MELQEQFEHQGNWLFKRRGTLPLLLLLAGIVARVYYSRDVTPLFDDTPFRIDGYIPICILVSLLGLAIRAYTVGHAADKTSGRNTSEQIAETLNQTGIYSIVRHPLYLGNFIAWLGIALSLRSYWFVAVFSLVYWIYYERIMFAEERFLQRKFGETFSEWARRTPAFIPDFRLFVRPENPFRWRKVLRQEKNGLAALFIIFSLFDLAGQLASGSSHYNYPLHGACIASILLYGILRYMKKKTHLLHDPVLPPPSPRG
jgi:protein-S-isoprenylcysteine O-methyltransferase Ste14